MKRSLYWHKWCLKTLKNNVEIEKARMERAIAEYQRLCDYAAFYELQINTAAREGKEDFDAERYLVGRKAEV